MSKPKPVCFATQVTTDQSSGDVISVYFQIRRGKVAETREFEDGAAFADYDKYGYLLGIEILQPCRATIVDRLAEHESALVRRDTKAFMRKSGPRQMIAA